MGLALIVHGGAGAMSPARYDAAREGCRAAAAAGWQILLQGGSALDAVQAAIVTLEDDPGFNAGTGGVLTLDGRALLDAGLMDGATLEVGAVAGVERIKNPVALARAVLASPHALLMGAGAEEFARASGIALCDPSELVTPAQYARWQQGYRAGDDADIDPKRLDVGAGSTSEMLNGNGRVHGSRKTQQSKLSQQSQQNQQNQQNHKGRKERVKAGAAVNAEPVHLDGHKHGTVGAVAVDTAGRMAAGASTGGIGAKHPGRIGDTPLPGCGFYAEDGLGGVSCTGHGEDFIRLLLARRALDYMAGGLSPQAAANAAIRLLDQRVHGDGGLILLDSAGRVGYARNTQTMAHAFMTETMGAIFAGV